MTLIDRLLGRPAPRRASKAVTALGPWSSGIPLSLYNKEPQERARTFLKAYKVGWFYKAGKKIADDIAALDWSVSAGDAEEGEDETVVARPDLRTPFEALSPIDQFQRLMEAPVRDANGKVLVTGRQLLRKTQVRLDFAGAAAWFLEGADAGLPTAVYGISPTRLWPSHRNGELIGWVMDRDAPSGGVPFSATEILWFSTGNADDEDMWGTSVVEAVYSQVPITDLLARHTGDVLALGGRLSGMLWPKDRALNEDEYLDAQRAWRNVASDPNAARRMLIFPEPMEWAQGAATPQEIGIPELATLTRDEILTTFPISPYRLGVPTPGGLNSGEVRREDRKDYWEETIHPRADLIKETVQVGFLSLYEEAMGQVFDFDLEEPDLDDAPSLKEKAEAYKGLVSIGLDPRESLSAVGLSHIKWLGVPAPVVPPAPEPTPEPAPEPDLPTKAAKARDDIANAAKDVLGDFLHAQQDRVVTAMRETLPATKVGRIGAAKAPVPDWWDAKREDRELSAALRIVYDAATRQGLQVVADTLNRTVVKQNVRRVMDDLVAYGGMRVVDINARTLDALRTTLAEGVRRGYSIPQLVDGVPAEGFGGVLRTGLDNGMGVWSELRAETIARTETALSYNRAALDGYKEFGVQEVEAVDGDGDPECAERLEHGPYPIDEALAIEDHPNGTLDWLPIVPDKAVDVERFGHTMTIPQINITPEIHIDVPATVVNVPETVINLPAPIVNVRPEVTVQPAQPVIIDSGAGKARAIQDVRIVGSTLPPRRRLVKRDLRGVITEVSEE